MRIVLPANRIRITSESKKVDRLEGARRAYTSVEESVMPVLEDDQVLIYPNPARDLLHVKCANTERYRIELRDLTGKLVRDFDCAGECALDIRELNSGVYLLSLNRERKALKAGKLVIMK
jgi:hypothetical protein